MPFSHHRCTILNPPSSPYITYIRQGLKHAEGRVYSQKFRQLHVGEKLHLHDHKEGILCRITFLHVYSSFREMLLTEKTHRMLPQLKHIKDPKAQLQAGIEVYEQFPRADRVKKMGCVAIGLTYLQDLPPS